MMRYFLHIHDRIGTVRDNDGREFPELVAAIDEALRRIRSLLSEGVRAGALDLDGCIEIGSEDGVPILVVPFGNAITIMLPGRTTIMDASGSGWIDRQNADEASSS
jgi:hypothetical protein